MVDLTKEHIYIFPVHRVCVFSEEPELAEVLADPAADGYDRTFSMCQVEAKEFQATVRSTAYRVLKGVCNPGDETGCTIRKN